MLKLLNHENKTALVRFLAPNEHDYLQFYEYLPYLEEDRSDYEFWGWYSGGELTGALYISPYNAGVAYTERDCLPDFREMLEAAPSVHVYGRSDLVRPLLPLSGREPHLFRYGYLNRRAADPTVLAEGAAGRAKEEDIEAIIRFYRDKAIMIEVEDRLHDIVERGSAFVVKEGQTVVAAALAHSETKRYALIGAVQTDPEARGNGYATHCISKLLHHLDNKGKIPYLFYTADAPHLAKLYDRFGFTHTTDYLLVY